MQQAFDQVDFRQVRLESRCLLQSSANLGLGDDPRDITLHAGRIHQRHVRIERLRFGIIRVLADQLLELLVSRSNGRLRKPVELVPGQQVALVGLGGHLVVG